MVPPDEQKPARSGHLFCTRREQRYAVVLTEFPMVAVGLATCGAGCVGGDTDFVPSLSPSASPATFAGGGVGWTVWGFTPEMLDIVGPLKLLPVYIDRLAVN